MIEITYYRKYQRVTITGHAMSEEKDDYDHDLVCCAVSTLAYTLADRVQGFALEKMVRSPEVRMGKGDSEIGCSPDRRYKAIVTLVFDTIYAGFELLENSYPASVKCKVHGG